MKNDQIVFHNGKIILTQNIVENHYLYMNDGVIQSITKNNPNIKDATYYDLKGKYISPGFIELHAHGGKGYDFMDGTFEALESIANFHSKHGVTTLYPTSLSGKKEETLNFLELFKEHAHKIKSCHLLGVHLEGPYFAAEQRGAQDLKYIRKPKPAEYNLFLQYDSIKRWSIAPEIEGALILGKILKNKNISASVAHSNGIFEDAKKALEYGFDSMTHLYSGMSGVTRKNAQRFAGIIEAGLYFDQYYVEVIADGHHLPASLLKFIYKCKGPDKIILVTDAMRGAGLENGVITKLGSLEHGQDVIIDDGVAKTMDKCSFAGSVATANQLIKNMMDLVGIPLHEAVKMMTINPAKLMKIDDRKGSIEIGKDADLIIFDEHINIESVYLNGKRLKDEN